MSRGEQRLFGERLKKLRLEKKIPQKELAAYLGISIRGYQFYESEDNEPNIKMLIALADFYGVTIDYLVGRTDERP
ncbi:helix-turn-helix domain-containing protein [Pseudoflavonifractor phocaeensis]|uniref:helix-turn-helix domain-containing protein n=1 Tax=Pseudoflavonifractor phocaeensis TaxID=1870988 RepID=UPI001F1B15AF